MLWILDFAGGLWYDVGRTFREKYRMAVDGDMREKRVRLLLLLFALPFALAACGGGSDYKENPAPVMPIEVAAVIEEEAEEIVQDFVFLPETIYFEEEMWTAKIISAEADSLFLLYHPMGEEFVVGVARMERDGSDFVPLWTGTGFQEEDESGDVHAVFTDIAATAARPAGGVFLVRHHYDSWIRGDDFHVFESYTLMAMDSKGRLVQERDLSEVLDIPVGTMFEILRVQGLSDGRVLLNTWDTLYVLAEDFRLEREIPLQVLDFIVTGGDRIFVSLWEEAGERHLVLPFDLESGQIDETADSLFYTHLNNTVAGTDHDLYITTGQAVFGFDIETRQFTQLFDWTDLDSFASFRVVPSPGGELFFIERHWGLDDIEHRVALVRMDRHDPPDRPAQVELIYGALMADAVLRREVVAFNRENQDYRIRIREYYNRLGGDIDQARADFHRDILAGDVLDIVDFSFFPFGPYARGGLLADLGALLDGDEDLGDLVENVRRLLEMEERLYVIAGEFALRTLVGPRNLLEEEIGWTMEAFLDAAANLPPDMAMFDPFVTREHFVEEVIGANLGRFFHWERGEANFDSPLFRAYLEFADTLPAAGTDRWPGEWENDQALEQVLFREYTLRRFSDFLRMQESFGGDIHFIGYPGTEGGGTVLIPHMVLGISAGSEHREVGWAFVRRMLTETFQERNVRNFSVMEAQLEGQVTRARRGTTPHEFPAGHVPLSQAEVRQMLTLIEEADLLYLWDEALRNIVEEEAAVFFAGGRSAEDTGREIQERAKALG